MLGYHEEAARADQYRHWIVIEIPYSLIQLSAGPDRQRREGFASGDSSTQERGPWGSPYCFEPSRAAVRRHDKEGVLLFPAVVLPPSSLSLKQ